MLEKIHDVSRLKICSSATLISGLEAIESGGARIVFVDDECGRLVGTLTDGDVRRAILAGATLNERVGEYCNANYLFSTSQSISDDVASKARILDISYIPVLDADGRITKIVSLGESNIAIKRNETVVLMLGGLGSRLRPLTDEVPKPLLPIGGVPITEIILRRLISNGFYNFIFSINYRGDQIRDYFGDGSMWDVSISYVEESKRMGTAGSLSLMEDLLDENLIVMNGDLLSKINCADLVAFTKHVGASGAVCVRPHDYTVPYGVVRVSNDQISGIEEKPTETFFVNAGVYVLSKKHVSQIPKETFYDMPDLINKLVENGEKIISFPVYEYWLDIGELSQYEKAQKDFITVFDNDGAVNE